MSAPPLAEHSPVWPRSVAHNLAGAFGQLARPMRGGTKPVWRAYGRLAAGAVLAVAILVLMMVFIDVAAVRAGRQSPAWLVAFFQVATQFGLSGWFLFPLAIALAIIALAGSPSLPRMTRLVACALSARLGFVFMAIAIPGLVVAIVKRVIGRARPLVSEDNPFLYHFPVWRPDYASLPSGHATTAFAAAVAIGILWPRLRPLLWTYAVLIAVSRVVIGAHHPSDVLAGAIAGVVGALLVRDWLAARRLAFIICADGRVVPMPGPSFARIKEVARRLLRQ